MPPDHAPQVAAPRRVIWRVLGLILLLGGLGWPWIKDAKESSILKARPIAADASTSEGEGDWVAVTGPLQGAEPVGDPLFLEPGPELLIRRHVEMYGWVEHQEVRYHERVPNSKRTLSERRYTAYTYNLEWTNSPESSRFFRHREGHQNPPAIPSASFSTSKVRIGSFEATPDFARTTVHPLHPAPERLRPGADGFPAPARVVKGSDFGSGQHDSSVYLFQGKGTPLTPELGDIRVSFHAIPPFAQATLIARRQGRTLLCDVMQMEQSPCQLFEGDWDKASQSARSSATYKNRFGRRASLVLIWLGLALAFGSALAQVGIFSRSRAVRALQIALVLSVVALVLWATTQAGAAM